MGDDVSELNIEARIDNLDQVMAFIDGELEKALCPMKAQMQIDVAVEEVFVNIASYAYEDVGNALIRLELKDDPARVEITFTDSGVPYDPTKKEDPDVTLSIEEREIGGLGIFMVKKSMDEMAYEYRDGCNILTITKYL